ncbi:MAG: cyclohydrolase [Acidobacteriota bacterium]|jgi:GTP cyclohydrolase I|nr:cyclohydrolase [Acidobacteriota bacterium]
MTTAYRLTDRVDACDVQGQPDSRGIEVDRAGVSGLRYPISVLDRQSDRQHTVALISMSVALPHHFKGTHMSRFIEVLNEHRGEMTMHTIPAILRELRGRLDADQASIDVRFPYFLERKAPATGVVGLLDYDCAFSASDRRGQTDFVLQVATPVTSLCPCSKAISDYGAHNQRGTITIRVRTHRPTDFVWIEEVISIAEASGSAPVYPLLKRADERFVTMQAYDNPVFVEDMVRNVAVQLQADRRIAWFAVSAVNEESIHNHAAFAEIEWTREEKEWGHPGS